MRSKILALFVIGLFIISTPATPQAQDENFGLTLIFPADRLYFDTIAQTVKQQLSPLLVDIYDTGLARPTYLSYLFDHNYDLAIFDLAQVSKEFPSLWAQFSDNSSTGTEIYRTSDRDLMTSAGIDNPDKLQDKLDQYRSAESVSNMQQLAKEIQQIYNDEWLLDIPLASTSTVSTTWRQFTGFNAQEGLIKSLMLDAKWESNPNQRQEQERTTSEFHYALYNYQQLRNPLFYLGRDSFVALEPIFSSAFLKTPDDILYPNLVTSFEDVVNEDGSNTWMLNLRTDATWSDNEVLDAYDLKFTYDMASFDWIGASNTNDWDFLQSVEIIDDYTLNVTFANNALTNQYTLSDQYIIPEHILNQTFNDGNGIARHPYEGYNPAGSVLWQEYISDPVTAGPFTYNEQRSSTGSSDVFSRNINYWSPSIADVPDGIFNLTSGSAPPAYYFATFDEISLDTLVYHASASVNIDPNTLMTSFTTGSRDLVEFRSLNSDSDIIGDDKYQVEFVGNDGGGLVILFNPESQELADYRIRKAITQAINRPQVSRLIGYGQQSQLTPVSKFYPTFYNSQAEIAYDYSSARDTFRELGYDALDGVTAENEFEWPWERLPLSVTPVIISLLGLVSLRFLRSRE